MYGLFLVALVHLRRKKRKNEDGMVALHLQLANHVRDPEIGVGEASMSVEWWRR
jgi:hypothetical protein